MKIIKSSISNYGNCCYALLAATSNTPINVTTFDEDGDNLNACSLREALKTAEIRKSFGGCEVTDILSTTQKLFNKAGTYMC